jgi:hypothetical protein
MPLTKIQSLGITDGTIVNADINASAAIAGTKISGSFGKVLQVVNATYNTTVTSSSTTYVDTGLSASITPSSTSNKILIIISQAIGRSYTQSILDLNLLRGATSLFNPWANDILYTALTQHNSGYASINYLDSPSSTSSTTYKTQLRSYNTETVYAQYADSYSSITLMEIAV